MSGAVLRAEVKASPCFHFCSSTELWWEEARLQRASRQSQTGAGAARLRLTAMALAVRVDAAAALDGNAAATCRSEQGSSGGWERLETSLPRMGTKCQSTQAV